MDFFGSILNPASDTVVLSEKLVIPYTITSYVHEIFIIITNITPPHRNGIWIKYNKYLNNSSDYFSFFSGEIGETVEIELPTTNNSLFYGDTAKYYFGEKLPEGVEPPLSTIIIAKKITLKYTMTKSYHYLVFNIAEVID